MRKITFSIAVDVDADSLGSVTDQALAELWHLAQANPAPHGDEKAGDLVAAIGYEIVTRFLKMQMPELYNHQPRDFYWKTLTDNGKWIDGVWTPIQPDQP